MSLQRAGYHRRQGEEILALGPPDRLLLTHWHEAMRTVCQNSTVPIFVHENDREQTKLPIGGFFSKREKIGDDLEVIPKPGHTVGTTMFLWDNGDHRLLFPGDSIWVQGGKWRAVLLGESDREAYLTSLSHLIRGWISNILPYLWGSEEGQPYGYGVTRTQAQEEIWEELSKRLQSGENG